MSEIIEFMECKLLIILAISAIMAVFPIPSLYGQNTSETIGGELSSKVSWRIENNALYISGKDTVPTLMYLANPPWRKYIRGIQSVVIENGITHVGQRVFMHLRINSIEIPETVRNLAIFSFYLCKKLSVVEVKGATPPDINSSVFQGVKIKKVKLIVPVGTMASYQADPEWSKFGKIEESSHVTAVQPLLEETLAAPCTIHLTRTHNKIGAKTKLKVFLNGVEQAIIGNDQTIEMQTDRVKNMLYIQQEKGNLTAAMRRFDATAGGNIYIDFSIFYGNMTVKGEANEE